MKRILFLFLLLQSLLCFSQTYTIPVYSLNKGNEITRGFEKMLDIFTTYYPEKQDIYVFFEIKSCEDTLYRAVTVPCNIEVSQKVRGFLRYKDKNIFLTADSNLLCKYDLYFNFEKDTIIKTIRDNFNLADLLINGNKKHTPDTINVDLYLYEEDIYEDY